MEIRVLTFALLLAGSGASAQAEEMSSGFYAGSGAGLWYVDFDDIDFDESAPVVRAFGGYQLNEYVSFEAGFSNFFEASGDVLGIDVDVKATGWDASVRPTLPINDRFQAYGILGWMQYDFEVKVSDAGLSGTEDDSDNGLLYGLGGSYSLNDQWTLRSEWSAIDVDDANFGMFSLGATYNFR